MYKALFCAASSLSRLVVGLLFALSLSVSASYGAEVRATKPNELFHTGFADVVLEGKIERGDYERLLELIENHEQRLRE